MQYPHGSRPREKSACWGVLNQTGYEWERAALSLETARAPPPGIVPATGAERMSYTVRMKHHAIAIPKLTPADQILEAAKQLKNAIQQQPQ